MDEKTRATRAPVRFLEPSARVSDWKAFEDLPPVLDRGGKVIGCTWKSQGVWDPRAGAVPQPVTAWAWVIAPTLFLGCDWIARPFQEKEIGQLLDYWEDWADAATASWHSAGSMEESRNLVPCRLPTVFLLGMQRWWATGDDLDLGSTLGWEAPRLVQRAEDYDPTAERTSLRAAPVGGALLEPEDALNVTVAVKADSEGFDSTLWDIGGKGEVADRARDFWRWRLHRLWYVRLENEA